MGNKKKKFKENLEPSPKVVPGAATIKASSEKEALDLYTKIIEEAKVKAKELALKYNVSKIHIQFIDDDETGEPIIVFIKPITMPVFKLMSSFKDDAETAHEVLAENLVLEESSPLWKKYDDNKLEVIKFISLMALKKNSTSITVSKNIN